MGIDYFLSERNKLRAAMERAKENPSAGLQHLGGSGEDPDVERLLEGFAYLSARLQRRVDEGVHQLAERLCELLVPSTAHATPPTTIMRLERPDTPGSKPQALHSGVRLVELIAQRGGELRAPCEFQTRAPVRLLPLKIVQTTLDVLSGGKANLRLRLVIRGGSNPEDVFDQAHPLRFYLQGEQAYTLHFHLLQHCESVRLIEPERGASLVLSQEIRGPGRGAVPPLGQFRIDPVGFAPEESILPDQPFTAPGLRLLQEFAVIPQKFLFVDVLGLAASLKVLRGDRGYRDQLEIQFDLSEGSGLAPPLSPDTLLLHCTPAVNLFTRRAHPIALSAGGGEYDLRAEHDKDTSPDIRRVLDVRLSSGPGTPERHVVPFYSFEHAADGAADAGYYAVHRGTDDREWSILYHPRDTLKTGAALSIRLECTNGDLAPKLGDGIAFEPREQDNDIKVQSLYKTSLQLPAGAVGTGSWKVLAHIAANRRGVADRESLQALLDLCLTPARDRFARCGGIAVPHIRVTSVEVRRGGAGLVHGLPVPRITVDIEVDEQDIKSVGEASILAAVLTELYSAHLSPNAFLQLTLTRGNRDLVWRKANGCLWVVPR